MGEVVKCSECDGTGRSACPMIYGTNDHPSTCPVCGGSNTDTCAECNGKGKIEEN